MYKIGPPPESPKSKTQGRFSISSSFTLLQYVFCPQLKISWHFHFPWLSEHYNIMTIDQTIPSTDIRSWYVHSLFHLLAIYSYRSVQTTCVAGRVSA